MRAIVVVVVLPLLESSLGGLVPRVPPRSLPPWPDEEVRSSTVERMTMSPPPGRIVDNRRQLSGRTQLPTEPLRSAGSQAPDTPDVGWEAPNFLHAGDATPRSALRVDLKRMRDRQLAHPRSDLDSRRTMCRHAARWRPRPYVTTHEANRGRCGAASTSSASRDQVLRTPCSSRMRLIAGVKLRCWGRRRSGPGIPESRVCRGGPPPISSARLRVRFDPRSSPSAEVPVQLDLDPHPVGHRCAETFEGCGVFL